MISILPPKYKDSDPRQLLYHYPSMNIILYAKKMQKYAFYQSLAVAENIAHKQGYLLIPNECMHWQRKERFSNRRVKIGRHSFFMMEEKELTKTEKAKLINYLEELKGKAS